jgi:hypothetical protein
MQQEPGQLFVCLKLQGVNYRQARKAIELLPAGNISGKDVTFRLTV